MAFSMKTVDLFSGAVADILGSDSYHSKAEGDRLEATNYDRAAVLARQNEEFTKTSTEIRQSQLDRQIYQTIGGQTADVAGAGFAASGSALDLMRDSAAQGALTKAVAGQQGLITEAGYEEQAKSFETMSQVAQLAASAEDRAGDNSQIMGAIKGVAGIASLFLG